MKKIGNVLIRVIVMIIVFIITVHFVNKFQNREYENLATEMEEAQLPLAYVRYEDSYINCMHGYTTTVDTTLLRDTITPIDENKNITIVVDDNKDYAKSYAYELRSIAGDSLIENGELEASDGPDGNAWLEVNIRMDVEPDMEYMLIIKLTGANDQIVRYYTRVVVNADYHADELLKFVNEFHAATYDADAYKEESIVYKCQQEYNNEKKKTLPDYGLGHVNLGSSYEALMWNGLEPMAITSIIPSIKEIDVNYAVIELDYKMTSTTSEDTTSYYSTKEYYQVSFNEGEIYLINFDRYVDEYFCRNEVDTLNNVYEIGIVSDPLLEYRYSSDNKKLSFVRNGQLWMYDYGKNQISLVYSFWMDDFENAANTYDNYDINIISMDDNANICFAVYGYMNRGMHEGQLGISLYEFDAESMELEELLFVENDVPYEAMKSELSKLTYYDGECFYFMLGGKVNKIDIANKQLSYLVDGLSANNIYTSKNMEAVAYGVSDNQTDNNKLTLINLKTGNSYDIAAASDECLICYGFKDSDMVYGVSDISDKSVQKDMKSFKDTRLSDDFADTIPTDRIYIVDENGNQIKEYRKTDYYIAQVDIETDLLYLTRCKKTENSFTADSDDFITFKEDEENPGITTVFRNSEYGFTKLYFAVPEGIYLTYVPNLNITKNKIKNDVVNMVVSIPNDKSNYMVYDNLGLSRIFAVAGDAINYAIDISGIAVSKNGEVIYRKTENQEYNTIASAIFHHSSGSVDASLQDCLYMVLTYQGVTLSYNDLSGYTEPTDALNTYGVYEGIDISGLSLEMLLGYVGDGVPVISRINDGRYVLVVSYNSMDVRYYDPVEDEEIVKSREDFEDYMEAGGNILYSYVNN
ncbi:MAG: hypothetical protein ACI4EF_13570 [Coprococcus sp.]